MIFCVDAHKNLNIAVVENSIAISPCCLTLPKKINKIDFVNNEYLQYYRLTLDSGEFPVECASCQKQEQQGKPSRRIDSNTWYRDHGHYNNKTELFRLDYWTGDLCNLRCAICGPDNSSAWKEELKIPLSDRTNVINTVWQKLDLEHIKYIHFNGGEPLLNKEHVQFLKSIPDKNQVHLNYNTNGTVRPNRQLIDLWGQFKLVQIDFSIDDINDRFEYQRYPAKWETVSSNLQWFIDNSPVNCMFAVNTTVSILNESNLENLNFWLRNNFSANRITDPIEFRQQPAHGILAVTANKSDAVKFLDACDQRRGTKWRDTFPELITRLS